MIMSVVLQRPLVAGLVVVVIWLAVDRAWLARSGISRWVQRRRLEPRLRAQLEVNPHNRDARFQLAELLVHGARHDEALSLIEENLAAGDDNDETYFIAGVAAFGASAPDAADRAEVHLAAARDKSPGFRSGAIELALGRGRLAHGHFATAQDALEDAIVAQPGSVEAHVLLARALAGQDKTEQATAAKARAWKLYTEAPQFKRRQVRTWAWRAKPMAAVKYIGGVVAVAAAIALVLARLAPSFAMDLEFDAASIDVSFTDVDGFNVDITTPPPASRFALTVGGDSARADSLLPRWDLNGNDIPDMQRKGKAGDMWCRMRTHYPGLATSPPPHLQVLDRTTNTTFGIHVLGGLYSMGDSSRATIYAFEALLEATPPRDCTAVTTLEGTAIEFGIRNGSPF